MDAVMELVQSAVTSPWFYLVLFAVSAIDGFFPVVPAESTVITAGVYAASAGQPDLGLVVVLAAAGAFVGDHVSFVVGRLSGGRLQRRLKPGTRRHGAFAWARRTLAERGGLILVVARYVPGGRTAVTMTMGATGYPLRSFSLFASIAAVSWAVYGALLGYLGGTAFEHDPIKGVAVGLGLALSVTVVVETVRFVVRRRRSAVRGAADGAVEDGASEDGASEDGASEDGAENAVEAARAGTFPRG